MIDTHTHTTDPAVTLQGAALPGTCRRTQQGAARGGTARRRGTARHAGARARKRELQGHADPARRRAATAVAGRHTGPGF